MTNAEIEQELKISHQTIIEWTSFFREVCINDVLHCSEPIGGNGVEVEIDESKIWEKENIIKATELKDSGYLGDMKKYNKSKNIHDTSK